MFSSKTLTLPNWVGDIIGEKLVYPSVEERMTLAIQLAEKNIQQGGGPFGACVFEIQSGKLVAPGVNVVVHQNCSLAHAESIAIMMAQELSQTYDLGASDLLPMELVTSAQPCIQCYGNLWWSGIKRLIIGANKGDVEEITGFQEGPIPPDWIQQLEHRSPLPPVTVVQDVLREQACDVLRQYMLHGGKVYNPMT